jgi:hypothetical protein
MACRSIRKAFLAGLAAVVMALACPSASQALLVDPGWDLFQTVVPQTNFLGDTYKGVPLGAFNFGGSIGTQPTGPTDTIVQRTSAVSAAAGGTGTTPLVMNALQLMSTGLVDFTKFGGSGMHTAFITLTPSMPTTGTMAITFDPTATATNQFGSYSSTLDVFFDIHQDTITGPIVASSSAILSATGDAWTHTAPPGAVLINGANNNLNGTDNTNDFWPGGPANVPSDRGRTTLGESAQGLSENHFVNESGLGSNFIAPAPEPSSTVLLISAGLAGVIGWGRKRFRKQS